MCWRHVPLTSTIVLVSAAFLTFRLSTALLCTPFLPPAPCVSLLEGEASSRTGVRVVYVRAQIVIVVAIISRATHATDAGGYGGLVVSLAPGAFLGGRRRR